MKNTSRIATCSIVLAVALFAPIVSDAQSDSTEYKILQGVNALDHRLQRPLPNERFENKSFGDHFFFTIEAAPTFTHRSYGQILGRPDIGARGGISIGDWFTPVHGMKVGINLGARTEFKKPKHLFAGLSLDYMMNLSSLAHKYDPNRKIEFISIIGAEYQRRFKSEVQANVFGAHLGLQSRFYVSPTTFLYIEPRINIFSDNVNTRTSWQKYDWEASLLVGLGYRISPISKRFRTHLDNQYIFDNTFYGFGAGGNILLDKRIKNIILGANASMYIGTWASTISGWRLLGTAGAFGIKKKGYPKFAALELDYLFNVNAAVNGYNPESKFNTNLILGPALSFTSRTSSKLHLGGVLGIQGLINLTNNLQFVIEPKAFVFKREFAAAGHRANILGSFNIGLQYRLGRYKDKFVNYDFSSATEDFLASNKLFMTFGGGFIYRDKAFKNNPTAWVGFGHWFSPVSAWRATVGGDLLYSNPKFADGMLSAEYMLSLSSMFCGYNPDRIFDLQAFCGAHGGIGRYNVSFRPVGGFQAGLHVRFNVSERIDLFVEPQIKATYAKDYSRSLDKCMRVYAGFNYKFGKRQDKVNFAPSDNDNQSGALDNYVAITGGPGILSKGGRLSNVGKLCGGFDLVYGQKLSSISSVQAGLGYDFPKITNTANQIGIGNIHVDYVLNVLNLIEPDPARKFHLNALVGVGFGWSNYHRSSIGLVTQGGLQFKWDVSKHIDIIAEPRATFWQPRVCQLPNKEHFVADAKVMLGVSYKF